MRIFLDANVMFSAARSDGAMRQLLLALHLEGHAMVADTYVVHEARRNLALKASADALAYLEALVNRIEVHGVPPAGTSGVDVSWLPVKDRPVLEAAVHARCDALVTGDKTHFGLGFGRVFGGVLLLSPAQLARHLWPDPAG